MCDDVIDTDYAYNAKVGGAQKKAPKDNLRPYKKRNCAWYFMPANAQTMLIVFFIFLT